MYIFKQTKGVVIAVFEMSAGLTEIWLYALTRSSFEKIVDLCNVVVKSLMCGIG